MHILEELHFQNKNQLLSGIRLQLNKLCEAKAMSPEELERFTLFASEKLNKANTEEEFSATLSEFFAKFKAFESLKKSEDLRVQEILEKKIIEALMENPEDVTLSFLTDLDLRDPQVLGQKVKALPLDQQIAVWDALTLESA